MKKIIITLLAIQLCYGLQAQSTSLDFSMQLHNNNHEVLIYPNPITDLHFKVKSSSVITGISVVDMVGKELVAQPVNTPANKEIRIDLPSCNKGIYMVKITFADGENVIKKVLYK